MGIRATLVKPFAHYIARQIARWSKEAVAIQQRLLPRLLAKAQHTQFGQAHALSANMNYEDFCRNVPIRDYEGLRPWIDHIIEGQRDVLWPGRPRYLAKTSGTTSGVKYIPITHDSLPNHFGTARNALFNYYARTGKGSWLDGKMIFLSGSPELEDVGGIPTGRLSGIANHLVPAWLRTHQLPSYQTNCIEDWEAKLDAIVAETHAADMRLISGIPPWVQMYYERLLAYTGKRRVLDVFPNYSVFVYGGVNFEPYRAKLESLVGGRIDSVETYPASEGFIAFQDSQEAEGLLLNVASGIFFEFVPADEILNEHPTRLDLSQVTTGVNYAVILTSNAGLWAYNLGDTVVFVSLDPPRLRVTGRIKHFISAFGEHVIGKEVEEAMRMACAHMGGSIVDFTVAPQVSPPEGGLPYHEWFVEFAEPPADLEAFAQKLDEEMVRQNIYYRDLIEGRILRPLVVRPLQRDAFRKFMKARGKLGGQHKTPRLANDRQFAEQLQAWVREDQRTS